MRRYTRVQEGPLLKVVESGLKEAVTSRGLTWREGGESTKKQKYIDLIVNHYTPDDE